MASDVRVRLSAEGVADVVEALRRINNEAKKAGEQGAGAFHEFKEEIKDVGKELVGFLAIGYIADQIKDLFAEVVQGAGALADLHEQTGLSTDALQALGAAATETGANTQSVNAAIQTFTKNVGLAELGSKKALQGFSALGINMAEFKKKTADAQFEEVIKRLSEIEDESVRAAVGAKLFGGDFIKLADTFKKVADEGIDHFIDKLKEMGVYLDRDTIARMKQVQQQTRELKEEAKGLATQFLVGLMPSVSQAMDQITKDINNGPVSGLKTLGEWVGKVLELITTGFRIAGATIGYAAARITEAVTAGKDGLKDFWNTLYSLARFTPAGRFMPDIKPFQTSANYQQRTEAMRDEYGAQLTRIIEDFKKGPAPAPPLAEGGVAGRGEGADEMSQQFAEIARARAALLQAQLAAELKIYQAQSKLREDQEARDYEAGKLSLEKYFDDRAEIINGRFDREIAILTAKRDAIAALQVDKNDEAAALKKQADLAAANAELKAKEFERQSALAQLAQQQLEAQRKIALDKLSIDQRIQRIEGDIAGAARAALEAELLKLDEILRRTGKADEEIKRIIADARAQGEAKIGFDEAKRNADAQFSTLQNRIQQIQDQVTSGQLFPLQAEQQIMALQREAIPELERIVALMRERAELTKDPQLKNEAEQFAASIRGIAIAADEAGRHMAELKATAQAAFENGISGFLQTVALRTDSVSNAFRSMAASITAELVRVEAQFLSKQFVKWLLGKANGGEGGKGGGLLGSIAAAFGLGGDEGGAAVGAATSANTAATAANTAALAANTAALTSMGALAGAGGAGGLGSLFGGLGGAGSTSGSGSGFNWLGMFSTFASFLAGGGQVRGPGTGTSDSIPAMLSNGEFVVNAEAVRQPGMLALLHAINGTPGVSRGRPTPVQKYAAGGMVGGGVAPRPYVVDASSIPHHIIEQAINKKVLEVIAGNPARVRQSIGG